MTVTDQLTETNVAVEYIVISCSTGDELTTRVGEALRMGFELQGGLQITVVPQSILFGKEQAPKEHFHQAMVR